VELNFKVPPQVIPLAQAISRRLEDEDKSCDWCPYYVDTFGCTAKEYPLPCAELSAFLERLAEELKGGDKRCVATTTTYARQRTYA